MKTSRKEWLDPRNPNFGSMPSTPGNLLSGIEIDRQLMGEDATGGIGNNFQDDLNMIEYGQTPSKG